MVVKSIINDFFSLALHRILLTVFTVILTVCFATPTALSETLVFGTLTKNPQKFSPITRPLADYLAKGLASMGVERVELVFARSSQEMNSLLESGQVDLFSETLFSAVQFQQNGHAEFLARRWKKGVDSYRSIIFVRQDSGIESLPQLLGKSLAFEDQNSTSGFYLPAALLMQQGFKLVRRQRGSNANPSDAISYRFASSLYSSGGEQNIITWVHRRMINAGAISDNDWNLPETLPNEIKQDLKIIYTSEPVPRSIMLVRRGLTPELKQGIKQVLFNAHLNEEGRQALLIYEQTKQFDQLDPQALTALERANALQPLVDQLFVQTSDN